MLALAFTFTAGRYHATPWGRHVNEADVAWPPEPWRILRTLVAVWCRKAETARFTEADFASLIDSLAEAPPDYVLPERAIHAHSRHYMPQGTSETKLVFDAFARFPAKEPIVAVWPDLSLDDRALDLLRHLAERIGYLGRAESWADCQVWTTEGPWRVNCRLAGRGGADESDARAEAVRVIAPHSAAGYAEERSRLLAAAEAAVLAKWSKPKPPTAKAMAKEIASTAAVLPDRLVDALALDTDVLQRRGWSRPPASRVVLYHRVPLAPSLRRAPVVSRAEGHRPQVARFLLAGRPRPRLEDAVRIGELMRLATLARSPWITDPVTGARRPSAPPIFTGKDAEGRPLTDDPAHAHAFWLPQDADGDGFIDHVVVYAACGFDAEARKALDGVTRLWLGDRHRRSEGDADETPEASREWRLALEGFGTVSDLAKDVPYLGTSRSWVSVTPFLAAGHLKRGGYPAEVRRLLVRRGIVPADRKDEVMVTEVPRISVGGQARLPAHFHRSRSRRTEQQPDATGAFLRITLPVSWEGPLALGYACHYGLGLFVPEGQSC